MSAYHSMELCFLAGIYTNFLITKQPMWLHFKPYPRSFPDNILRVSPDILPPGSIYIEECLINGKKHDNFDAFGLTVKLPNTDERMKVKVKVSPASWLSKEEGRDK